MNKFFSNLNISPKIYLPIIYIIAAFIIFLVLSKVVDKLLVFNRINKKKSEFQIKREKTIVKLINNVIKYLLAIFTILAILKVFGVDTTGMITSLGIAGAILGLAFQDIIKNLLRGITIIFDNHYVQGDIVTINGFKGEVIELGLQATKIKSYTGEVMIISNSQIDSLINHSMYDTNLVISLPVSKNVSLEKLESMINSIIPKIKKMDEVKGDVTLLGVDKLDANKYNYSLIINCYPNNHFSVNRAFMKYLKEEYEKNKIEVPGEFLEVVKK